MPQAIARLRQRPVLLLSIWIGAALALLPVFFHWQAAPPLTGHRAHLESDAAYLFALLLCWAMYRAEQHRSSRQRRLVLVFLILLLTALTNSVHRFFVDHATLVAGLSNSSWQLELQEKVLQLSPAIAPHSYRFLPNSLVRWLEIAGVGYDSARDIYRLIFGLLLFYAVYRFARLFTDYGGALIALLLAAAIYPVSFEYYAGQLTDPLSHLSFVLAFIFIATGDFALLLTTLLLGALAKETVLAMAGFYALFQRSDRLYRAKAATLLVAALVCFGGVRAFVLHTSGAYHYQQVSGVTPQHAWANLTGGRWQAIVLLTAGALVPLLILGWKTTPLVLKQLAIFLFCVLFVSSVFFGWLFEGRNFMPLVFVLAVAGGKYLSNLFAEPECVPREAAAP